MITVAAIAYTDVKDQPELLAEYAAECGVPVVGQPDPQWEMYAQIQAAGLMQGFAVYVDDVMAGFACVLMTVLPHYGFKAATVESLFVALAQRSSGAGTRLMAHVEREAERAGCKVILYSAPADGQLEALLGKRYARTNSVFYKPLG
jgi:GNAT superfamily N-acetyltransferase